VFGVRTLRLSYLRRRSVQRAGL